MTDFFLNIPSKVLFGMDVVNRIGYYAEELGSRVLIVTEAILYESETINRIQEFLSKKGISFITFDEVVPNATSSCIEDGIRLARISKINMVIGLGGVRTLSVAKMIAMAVNSKYSVDDYLSGFMPDEDPVPYIEVPTTCRNPFMLTDEYLITDARTRRAFLGKAQGGITKYILIDPKLSESLPGKYRITTLIDTFVTALEGYISTKSNFLSDSFFLKAIELVGDIILGEGQNREDLKSSIKASTAGCLTALGLTMSKPGAGTAVSYALNARQLIPKSWVSIIMLPHILEFNLNACNDKLKTIAGILGENIKEETDETAAKTTVLAVQRLLGPLNLPSRFSDFDIRLDHLVEVAENAYSFDMINYLPKGVTVDVIYNLLKTAY